MLGIDEVDRRLLTMLQADGRITQADLARAVGLTAPAVMERVRKLEDRGLIAGYTARLDPELLGLHVRVLIAVTLARHQENAIDSFLATIDTYPEITGHYHLTGRFDFMLQGYFSDVRALKDFVVHKLTALPTIDRAETFLVLSGVDRSELPLESVTVAPTNDRKRKTKEHVV
jgi:Lrp/AsnC family leucine-responsive transcriptional regulator